MSIQWRIFQYICWANFQSNFASFRLRLGVQCTEVEAFIGSRVDSKCSDIQPESGRVSEHFGATFDPINTLTDCILSKWHLGPVLGLILGQIPGHEVLLNLHQAAGGAAAPPTAPTTAAGTRRRGGPRATAAGARSGRATAAATLITGAARAEGRNLPED